MNIQIRSWIKKVQLQNISKCALTKQCHCYIYSARLFEVDFIAITNRQMTVYAPVNRFALLTMANSGSSARFIRTCVLIGLAVQCQACHPDLPNSSHSTLHTQYRSLSGLSSHKTEYFTSGHQGPSSHFLRFGTWKVIFRYFKTICFGLKTLNAEQIGIRRGRYLRLHSWHVSILCTRGASFQRYRLQNKNSTNQETRGI